LGTGRCRICQTLLPPEMAAPQVVNPAYRPYQPPPDLAGPAPVAPAPQAYPYAPPAPAPTPVAPAFPVPGGPPPVLPPPGGWQPSPGYPPPPSGAYPPPPVGGYPAPPPGWYPGAPPQKKRRTGLIVLCVVVPVLVLAAIGLFFVRSTDPGAAKDRDAAEAALLTNGDLGGTFHEIEHNTFARSRGGVRIEQSVAGCDPANAVLEDDGQAYAESVFESKSAFTGQVVAQQVIAMGSESTADRLLDVLAGSVRSCVVELIKTGGPSLVISVSPAPTPIVGDRAVAFSGSVGAGGPAAGEVDIVVAKQGRAVALVITVDTAGSFHGDRLETAMRTLLARLAPTFGA
jgi:hypothetical protein